MGIETEDITTVERFIAPITVGIPTLSPAEVGALGGHDECLRGFKGVGRDELRAVGAEEIRAVYLPQSVIHRKVLDVKSES